MSLDGIPAWLIEMDESIETYNVCILLFGFQLDLFEKHILKGVTPYGKFFGVLEDGVSRSLHFKIQVENLIVRHFEAKRFSRSIHNGNFDLDILGLAEIIDLFVEEPDKHLHVFISENRHQV
jgi:hypothetical protein